MDKTKYSLVKTTEQEADDGNDGIELKEFKKSETDEKIKDVKLDEEIDKTETETENEVDTPFLSEEIETVGLVRSTQENGTEEELERLTTTNSIDVIPREEQTTTVPTASNETKINIRFWLIVIGGVLIVLAAITALFLFFCVFTVNYEQVFMNEAVKPKKNHTLSVKKFCLFRLHSVAIGCQVLWIHREHMRPACIFSCLGLN
jgi:hypothetical protein